MNAELINNSLNHCFNAAVVSTDEDFLHNMKDKIDEGFYVKGVFENSSQAIEDFKENLFLYDCVMVRDTDEMDTRGLVEFVKNKCLYKTCVIVSQKKKKFISLSSNHKNLYILDSEFTKQDLISHITDSNKTNYEYFKQQTIESIESINSLSIENLRNYRFAFFKRLDFYSFKFFYDEIVTKEIVTFTKKAGRLLQAVAYKNRDDAEWQFKWGEYYKDLIEDSSFVINFFIPLLENPDSPSRYSMHKKIVSALLKDNMYQYVIAEILLPSVNYLLRSIKKRYEHKYYKEIYVLTNILMIDIRYMLLLIMDEVTQREKKSFRKMEAMTMESIFSSFNDMFNNSISKVNTNLLKLEAKIDKATSKEEMTELLKRSIAINMENSLFVNTLQSIFTKSYSVDENELEIKEMDKSVSLSMDQMALFFNYAFYNEYKLAKKNMNIVALVSENITDSSLKYNVNIRALSIAIYAVIKNAYEADSSIVTINIKEDEGYLYFHISNDGDLIKKSIRDFIFNKYTTTKHGHNGLGLNYAANILEDVGMTIELCGCEITTFLIKVKKVCLNRLLYKGVEI